ncbi:MAG: NAD(P)H-hydrate dehydratase [Gammaproteobacteria bacterium]|nr:NAD(P)H-hydrate dehydratase [Gammaproteobacteria bacterium]
MNEPVKQLPAALYRADQVRELDRIAIEELKIPGLCLMERAGAAAFSLLRARWPDARKIRVLCGVGNNGGDGYVIARLAHIAGYPVSVLQTGNSERLKGDARTSFEALTAVGGEIKPFSEEGVREADVVADALFGTGLDREVTWPWRDAIEALHRHACPVLAVDIPSGLHADTGAVLGAAAPAQATITFIGLKQGLFTGDGPKYCGDVYFDDLKVPADIYRQVPASVTRLDQRLVGGFLGKRARTAHKGDFGHLLVIGGDHGFTGAARMAAEAAARTGAGRISLATRKAHADLMNIARPEIMSHGVETAEELKKLLAIADVIAIGPGLGQSEWSRSLLEEVSKQEKPVTADADALNLIAKHDIRLHNAVFTPHPGEAARLLDSSTADIHRDRFAAARAIQSRYGCTCVLKGAGSLIAGETGTIGLCSAGNPGMACGGMGDVLTGIIAGLLAQGLSGIEAARLGVCLHAAAADKAAETGERGLLAGDLFPWLRHCVNL